MSRNNLQLTQKELSTKHLLRRLLALTKGIPLLI